MRRKQLFLLIAIAVLVMGMQVEAKGRRWRPRANCIVQSAPLPSCAPCTHESTCPMYVWMRYGSYCSYFATYFDDCTAFSYDSTNCGLSSVGCDYNHDGTPTAPDSGCIPSPMLDADHPGHAGYGARHNLPLARKLEDSAQLPGWDSSELNVSREKSLVIKFNDVNQPQVSYYAQVFIAKVTLVQPPPRVCATAILARGLQIAPVDKVDLVLVTGGTGINAITPSTSHGRAYLFTTMHAGKQHSVEVIMHHLTVPHGR